MKGQYSAGVIAGSKTPLEVAMAQVAQSYFALLMSVALSIFKISMWRYTDSVEAAPCPAFESRDRMKNEPSWMLKSSDCPATRELVESVKGNDTTNSLAYRGFDGTEMSYFTIRA